MAKMKEGVIELTPLELVACIMAPFLATLLVVGVCLLVCCRRRQWNTFNRALLQEELNRKVRNKSADSSTEKSFLCEEGGTVKKARSSSAASSKSTGRILPAITIGGLGAKEEATRRVIRTFKRQDSGSSMGSASSSPEESENSPSTHSVEAKSSRKSSAAPKGTNSSTDTTGGYRTFTSSPLANSQSQSASNSHRKDSLSPLPSISGRRKDSGSTSGGSMDAGRRDSGEMLLPAIHKKRTQSLTPGAGIFYSLGEQATGPASNASSSSPSLGQDVTYPPDIMSESVSLVQAANRGRRRASMQDALDPTKINASIYEQAICNVTDKSINSIQEEGQGSMNFSLVYNPDECVLTVSLIQARDLTAREFSGTTDTYCKLCLLPDEKKKLHTKVHKNSQNPVFHEDFLFNVYPHELSERTLEIQMFDYDRFSRDECVGMITVGLKEIDLTDDVILWRPIIPKETGADPNLGDVMISMSYLPSAGRLTIHVLKGRNLTLPDDLKTLPSALVKVYLYINDRKIKKKKTRTARTSNNPVWNEALTFDAAKDSLRCLRIECMVYHDSLLSNGECLGTVVIGPDSKGEELDHWKELTNQKTAARWHHLTAIDKHT